MDWEKLKEYRDKHRLLLEEADRESHELKQMLTNVYFVGGIHDGKIMTEYEVEKELCNGLHNADLSEVRKNGGCVRFAVMDNSPCIDGYLSPMWDGGMLRYETPEVYNELSR